MVRHILAVVFGIIPKDTDDPRYKQLLKEKEQKKLQKEHEKEERKKMEVYYRKYGQDAKYRIRRFIGDVKFKRKKARDLYSACENSRRTEGYRHGNEATLQRVPC